MPDTPERRRMAPAEQENSGDRVQEVKRSSAWVKEYVQRASEIFDKRAWPPKTSKEE